MCLNCGEELLGSQLKLWGSKVMEELIRSGYLWLDTDRGVTMTEESRGHVRSALQQRCKIPVMFRCRELYKLIGRLSTA